MPAALSLAAFNAASALTCAALSPAFLAACTSYSRTGISAVAEALSLSAVLVSFSLLLAVSISLLRVRRSASYLSASALAASYLVLSSVCFGVPGLALFKSASNNLALLPAATALL